MKFYAILAVIAAVQAIRIKESGSDSTDPQEKLVEVAKRLDVELTPDMLTQQSTEEATAAVVEAALAAGKTEEDVEAAIK